MADIIQAKKYIEAIVNSITEPIIGLDRDRSILFANDEALTILNLKRENVMGKSATELALKNDLLRRLVRELIQHDKKKEPLKIYADDKESYFQAKYIPIHVMDGDGRETEYAGDVILLKNITEFKELDSAKTTFISTISHELKTPISAILMSLKLLEDKRIGDMNDEQVALAGSIRESSDRLLEITGELLKMTQVEAGKLQLNPKITKPIELIDYAIKANRVQAERFNCHIEVEYPEKISKLFVDSEKIAGYSRTSFPTPSTTRRRMAVSLSVRIRWTRKWKYSCRTLGKELTRVTIRVSLTVISAFPARKYREAASVLPSVKTLSKPMAARFVWTAKSAREVLLS